MEKTNYLFPLARRAPFVVRVNFDTNEAAIGADATSGTTNEQNLFPGVTTGFKLKYNQGPC